MGATKRDASVSGDVEVGPPFALAPSRMRPLPTKGEEFDRNMFASEPNCAAPYFATVSVPAAVRA